MDASAYHLRLSAEVVTRLEEGDARVDESLNQREWAELAPKLARLAAALGMRADQCNDVLHDVYLVARQQQPAGLAETDLQRWLFRVTANRCRLEHRRRGRWFQALQGLATGWRTNAQHAAAADERAQREELAAQVEAALGELSAVEREAVVLRYFCDFDSSEIGEMLSLPAATVRSHLLKARRRLARSLAPWNEEERT